MHINRIIVILVFVFSGQTSRSQEVLPISTAEEMQKLKDSKKGKVLLVNFWATWCVPCVTEFPDLMKLYNDYRDEGFEIIFISADLPNDFENKVKPFLKKNGAEFTSYYNNFENIDDLINFFDKNWGGGIPATYIFNRSGELTANFMGRKEYSDFEKVIKKILD